MSKGDWNLYAAIGIAVAIVAGGILGHQWDARHYYETAEPQHTVPDSGTAITVALAAPYQGEYGGNQADATPEQNSRAVWAAEDSAFWTMMTAIIGMAGTAVVSFSLVYSARAAEGAVKAAEAARITVEDSRNNALAEKSRYNEEMRPRLVITNFHVSEIKGSGTDGLDVRINYNIENIGKSTATKVRVRYHGFDFVGGMDIYSEIEAFVTKHEAEAVDYKGMTIWPNLPAVMEGIEFSVARSKERPSFALTDERIFPNLMISILYESPFTESTRRTLAVFRASRGTPEKHGLTTAFNVSGFSPRELRAPLEWVIVNPVSELTEAT